MIVKGYFNTNNGIFLGPVTAKNELTGAAVTPRYVEGVCFGDYNTETGEFIPLTNPNVIKGVMEINEDPNAFVQGGHKETITGVEEDKGLELARKQSLTAGIALKPGYTPGVVTKDAQGNIYDNVPITRKIDAVESEVEKPKVEQPEKITVCEEPRFLKKDEIPNINFEKLFK